MDYMKLGMRVTCRDCGFTETEDHFVLRNVADNGELEVNLQFLCRPCETNYPKADPRDWHMSAEEAENERQTRYTNGEIVRVDHRGMITEDEEDHIYQNYKEPDDDELMEQMGVGPLTTNDLERKRRELRRE